MLFDDRIDYNTKRNMAKKMLSTDFNQNDDEIEIDLIKKITLQLDNVPNFIKKDLPTDLVCYKSIGMFKRFGISTHFLKVDPAHWDNQKDFKTGKQIIKARKIVNDTAERGVKLIEEYNTKFTKDEEQKQFLLQTIQEYRKKYPQSNKKNTQTTILREKIIIV